MREYSDKNKFKTNKDMHVIGYCWDVFQHIHISFGSDHGEGEKKHDIGNFTVPDHFMKKVLEYSSGHLFTCMHFSIKANRNGDTYLPFALVDRREVVHQVVSYGINVQGQSISLYDLTAIII